MVTKTKHCTYCVSSALALYAAVAISLFIHAYKHIYYVGYSTSIMYCKYGTDVITALIKGAYSKGDGTLKLI
jgi:hypothetical protein